MYNITDYSFQQAKKFGVEIKPSTNKKKKIDVFKKDKKIASIGAVGYGDFGSYLKTDKTLANKRRELYKARHEKDRHIKGTNGYWSNKILW
jgi:hypothetical protein